MTRLLDQSSDAATVPEPLTPRLIAWRAAIARLEQMDARQLSSDGMRVSRIAARACLGVPMVERYLKGKVA